MARWYDPQVGRFLSADSIVPEPGEAQSLNRFAYAADNPLRYTDPDGHNPLLFCVALRVGYDVVTARIPGADRIRRDEVGGRLVTQTWADVSQLAVEHGIDATVVRAILRHEGAAVERRALTLLPSIGPGLAADVAEGIQVQIMGDTSSIGPGQMQVRRARELEQMGYVRVRRSEQERVRDLLRAETAAEYVTGMVDYLSDRLHGLSGFSDLAAEDQRRLVLIGYNLGWEGEKGLRANIEKHGYRRVIEMFNYDNQTLDEYLRWRAR